MAGPLLMALVGVEVHLAVGQARRSACRPRGCWRSASPPDGRARTAGCGSWPAGRISRRSGPRRPRSAPDHAAGSPGSDARSARSARTPDRRSGGADRRRESRRPAPATAAAMSAPPPWRPRLRRTLGLHGASLPHVLRCLSCGRLYAPRRRRAMRTAHGSFESISTKAMRHGSVPRLTQAWLVPCWTSTSPALRWISESSSSMSISPAITIA